MYVSLGSEQAEGKVGLAASIAIGVTGGARWEEIAPPGVKTSK